MSVVRAEVVGRTADLASYGTSGIVDPDGVVLATASPGMTGLIVADIETTPLERRRGLTNRCSEPGHRAPVAIHASCGPGR